jgi:hypothetical protein
MIKEIRFEDAMKRDFEIQAKIHNRKFGHGAKSGDPERPSMITRSNSNGALGLLHSALKNFNGEEEIKVQTLKDSSKSKKEDSKTESIFATPAKGL